MVFNEKPYLSLVFHYELDDVIQRRQGLAVWPADYGCAQDQRHFQTGTIASIHCVPRDGGELDISRAAQAD